MSKCCLFTAILCLSLFTASAAVAKTGDIIKLNSDIRITKDMVANDVVAIGGDVTVEGRVENNIVAIGGTVTLEPRSYVGGEIVVVGGNILKDQTAIIGEKITQIYMPQFIPSFMNLLKGKWLILWAAISVLALLGVLGLSILFIALAPGHITTIANIIEKSFVSMFFWGLLWAILVVPITVLLAISIIGIILIPFEIMLVVLAMIIGYIAAALFVGRKILSSFKASALKKVRVPFLDVILGILVLFVIGFVPVIGPVAKALFVTAGFGAVLISRFGTIK